MPIARSQKIKRGDEVLIHGRVIGGPDAEGVYTVRVYDTKGYQSGDILLRQEQMRKGRI